MEWRFIIISGVGILIACICGALSERMKFAHPLPQTEAEAMPETIFSCLALFAFIFAVLSIVNAFAAAFVSGLYALAAAVVAGVIGCFLRRMITY